MIMHRHKSYWIPCEFLDWHWHSKANRVFFTIRQNNRIVNHISFMIKLSNGWTTEYTMYYVNP
jgi:hypothetical protein